MPLAKKWIDREMFTKLKFIHNKRVIYAHSRLSVNSLIMTNKDTTDLRAKVKF